MSLFPCHEWLTRPGSCDTECKWTQTWVNERNSCVEFRQDSPCTVLSHKKKSVRGDCMRICLTCKSAAVWSVWMSVRKEKKRSWLREYATERGTACIPFLKCTELRLWGQWNLRTAWRFSDCGCGDAWHLGKRSGYKCPMSFTRKCSEALSKWLRVCTDCLQTEYVNRGVSWLCVMTFPTNVSEKLRHFVIGKMTVKTFIFYSK